jgi:hypothetical protein
MDRLFKIVEVTETSNELVELRHEVDVTEEESDADPELQLVTKIDGDTEGVVLALKLRDVVKLLEIVEVAETSSELVELKHEVEVTDDESEVEPELQ